MYQLSIKRLSSCFALALLLVAAGCAGPKPSITDASSAVVTVPPAAQRQYEEALEWMEAGEFEAAAVQFDAFVQRYPNYAGAYINLAIINVKLEPYSRRIPCTVVRIGHKLEKAPPAIERYYWSNEPLLPVFLKPDAAHRQWMSLRLGSVVKW